MRGEGADLNCLPIVLEEKEKHGPLSHGRCGRRASGNRGTGLPPLDSACCCFSVLPGAMPLQVSLVRSRAHSRTCCGQRCALSSATTAVFTRRGGESDNSARAAYRYMSFKLKKGSMLKPSLTLGALRRHFRDAGAWSQSRYISALRRSDSHEAPLRRRSLLVWGPDSAPRGATTLDGGHYHANAYAEAGWMSPQLLSMAYKAGVSRRLLGRRAWPRPRYVHDHAWKDDTTMGITCRQSRGRRPDMATSWD